MRHLQNEKGVSLIMAMILLAVVGVLVAALMSSSVHNIIFGQNELDQKRAFYAAEAGVEHLLSFGGQNVYNNYANDDNGNPIISRQYLYEYNDEIEEAYYKVEFLGWDSEGESKGFESIGTVKSGYGEFQQSIIFDFDRGGGIEGIYTLLYAMSNTSLYRAKETHYSNPDRKNEPGAGDNWEEKWEIVASEFEEGDIDFEDYDDLEMISQVSIWTDRHRQYEKGEFVMHTVEPSGADTGDYTVDNMLLFELLTAAEESDEYDLDDINEWSGFIETFQELFDKDFEREGEFEEFKQGQTYRDEHRIYSPYLELKGNEEEPDEWNSSKDYEEGDMVEYEGDYYEAIIDNEGEEPDDESEFWERTSDPRDWTNIEIIDSVIIVDGTLDMSNVELRNTLVIVRDRIEFGGTQTLDSSMIIGFNEIFGDDTHAISGLPSVDIEGETVDHEQWPIIRDIINTAVDPEDFVWSDELSYWRAR